MPVGVADRSRLREPGFGTVFRIDPMAIDRDVARARQDRLSTMRALRAYLTPRNTHACRSERLCFGNRARGGVERCLRRSLVFLPGAMGLSERRAVARELVGVVDQAIQDGIGEGLRHAVERQRVHRMV